MRLKIVQFNGDCVKGITKSLGVSQHGMYSGPCTHNRLDHCNDSHEEQHEARRLAARFVLVLICLCELSAQRPKYYSRPRGYCVHCHLVQVGRKISNAPRVLDQHTPSIRPCFLTDITESSCIPVPTLSHESRRHALISYMDSCGIKDLPLAQRIEIRWSGVKRECT